MVRTYTAYASPVLSLAEILANSQILFNLCQKLSPPPLEHE